MSIPLPDSISTFFQVSNGADASALEDCFTDDAVVRDEGHKYQGHAAIRAWRLEARQKYKYQVEPLDVAQHGSSVTVRTRVAGNFPGSPAEIEHAFQLADGRIEFLDIR